MNFSRPRCTSSLGDGAKWNWEFFGKHFPKAIWILDFFHAALHLHQAAELIFGAGGQAETGSGEVRLGKR
ncbi:MAG: hypothetical protein M3X11_03825 [Acidobacteriota bacterium]|nr:hypothetical protein [Acidobacteriota bacterium]